MINHHCPKCNDDKTELLSTAFNNEISNLTAQNPTLMDLVRDMLGVESGPLKQQPGAERSRLKKVAPPQKMTYFPILAFWFLTTLSVTIIQTTVGTLIGYGILIGAGIAVMKVYRFNMDQWPRLFRRWEQSYICLGCGHVFEGSGA